jgi:hypothetical protein
MQASWVFPRRPSFFGFWPYIESTLQHLRKIKMAERPIMKKPRDQSRDQDDSIPQKGQAQPVDKRFLLKVDGQTKTSFSTKEPASTAAAAIKKTFPIVVVTVVDTEQGTTETINVS